MSLMSLETGIGKAEFYKGKLIQGRKRRQTHGYLCRHVGDICGSFDQLTALR